MNLKLLISPSFSFRLFLVIIITVIGSHVMAQNVNNSKLSGKWIFERYEFINVDKDTTQMKNESQGLIIIFEKGNRFTTKKKTGTIEKVIEAGTYDLSDDGKYLYQNEEEAEIIILDNKRLVLKIEDAVIIHLKRLH